MLQIPLRSPGCDLLCCCMRERCQGKPPIPRCSALRGATGAETRLAPNSFDRRLSHCGLGVLRPGCWRRPTRGGEGLCTHEQSVQDCLRLDRARVPAPSCQRPQNAARCIHRMCVGMHVPCELAEQRAERRAYWYMTANRLHMTPRSSRYGVMIGCVHSSVIGAHGATRCVWRLVAIMPQAWHCYCGASHCVPIRNWRHRSHGYVTPLVWALMHPRACAKHPRRFHVRRSKLVHTRCRL